MPRIIFQKTWVMLLTQGPCCYHLENNPESVRKKKLSSLWSVQCTFYKARFSLLVVMTHMMWFCGFLKLCTKFTLCHSLQMRTHGKLWHCCDSMYTSREVAWTLICGLTSILESNTSSKIHFKMWQGHNTMASASQAFSWRKFPLFVNGCQTI